MKDNSYSWNTETKYSGGHIHPDYIAYKVATLNVTHTWPPGPWEECIEKCGEFNISTNAAFVGGPGHTDFEYQCMCYLIPGNKLSII